MVNCRAKEEARGRIQFYKFTSQLEWNKVRQSFKWRVINQINII